MLRFLLLAALNLPAGVQYGNPDEWRSLAGRSELVVKGMVDKHLFVVRKDKMVTRATKLPDGQVQLTLPNPSDYVLGRLVRIRVNEVLRKTGKGRAAAFIQVFLPGPLATHSDPLLIEGREYVLFLSPLRADSKAYDGAYIQRPEAGTAVQSRFSPRLSFTLVNGDRATIEITGKDPVFLNQVKAAVSSAPAPRKN